LGLYLGLLATFELLLLWLDLSGVITPLIEYNFVYSNYLKLYIFFCDFVMYCDVDNCDENVIVM